MTTIFIISLCTACVWTTLAAIAVRIGDLSPVGVPVVFVTAFLLSFVMLAINCNNAGEEDA